MNKKCLSVVISTFLLLNMVSGVSFAAKKDVADPVLQEIISELSSKMPRFINKYGAAIFVADEQITRGTLLQALYEYDKKSSSKSASTGVSVSAAGVISKKDYDALNTRVVALEKKVKNGASTNATASAKKTSNSTDLVSIMEDLEVNMPTLLDNTLKDSKVFKALEKKVNSVSSGNLVVAAANTDSSSTTTSTVSQKSLATIQRNIISLNKKVDAVELSLASVQNGTNVSASGKVSKSSTDTKVLSDLKNLQKEIDSMNEKVSLMEEKLAKSKGVSSVYSGPTDEDYNNLKKAVIQVNRSYVSLGKRVDAIEKEQQYYASSSNSSTTSSSLSAKQMQLINAKINSIRQSVDDIKADGVSNYSNTKNTADIKKIEKRLSNLENSKSSSDSEESSGSNKTGTIAKISLGLSLIAALFIAR